MSQITTPQGWHEVARAVRPGSGRQNHPEAPEGATEGARNPVAPSGAQGFWGPPYPALKGRANSGRPCGAGLNPERAQIIFLLLALSLAFAPPARAADELKVSVEPEVIGIDETATLTIEVHTDGLSSMTFRPAFELDNLETLGRPSQYDDMRFSNGTLSRTFRLSWQLRPLGLGRARVRAITVQLGDDVHQLPAHEIRVQQEPTQQARRSRPDDEDDPFKQFFGRGGVPNPFRQEPQQPDVFVRAEMQPPRPVVGQQVLYNVYLYTREDIAAISPSGVPPFKGFWVRDIPLPQQLPMEMVDVGGRRYAKVPVFKKALFALRPGHYQLQPATIDLTVQRYDRSFFFGPAVTRPIPVRVQTAAETLDVQPLPPAPPGFGGAVGQLALDARLEPRQVRMGEAATLTVRLSGVGNLSGIRDPQVAPQPGLTLLSPQQEGKDELNGSAVRGYRVWRYAVVPDRAGRFTLEAPSVTYFDPSEGRYQVATSPALDLTALPPPAAAKIAAASPKEALASRPAGLLGRRWSPLLAWLLVLPWGLVLVAALIRHRPAPGAASGSETQAAVRELEATLSRAEAEERARGLALAVEEGWRAFLQQRWGVPPENPPSRWRALLAARGVDDGALGELGLLIEDLQYLRSAPQLSSTDTLRSDALERSRRLLRRLA